ncbi:hypothetical protein LMG33818_002198 [Halomonadaceae bacterium LMG 33818]|uniref:type III secretion system stalk subunit SctO n=1 Tax=Cernens ardua TaxID=3402176 RepID=UPI003EDC6F16
MFNDELTALHSIRQFRERQTQRQCNLAQMHLDELKKKIVNSQQQLLAAHEQCMHKREDLEQSFVGRPMAADNLREWNRLEQSLINDVNHSHDILNQLKDHRGRLSEALESANALLKKQKKSVEKISELQKLMSEDGL